MRRTESRLDVEQIQTLTPWGDVRTSPELLEALRLESALPPARGDDLHDARLELAAEELNLRVPRAAREFDHPVVVRAWAEKLSN